MYILEPPHAVTDRNTHTKDAVLILDGVKILGGVEVWYTGSYYLGKIFFQKWLDMG
jgi:hypothetical protein